MTTFKTLTKTLMLSLTLLATACVEDNQEPPTQPMDIRQPQAQCTQEEKEGLYIQPNGAWAMETTKHTIEGDAISVQREQDRMVVRLAYSKDYDVSAQIYFRAKDDSVELLDFQVNDSNGALWVAKLKETNITVEHLEDDLIELSIRGDELTRINAIGQAKPMEHFTFTLKANVDPDINNCLP